MLLFTLIYKIMPKHKVLFSHALIAAATATFFFNLAKKALVIYSHSLFVNYHILYGSLAFVPLFLIWVYLCCFNLLFCAAIIYGLETKFSQTTQHSINKFKRKFFIN